MKSKKVTLIFFSMLFLSIYLFKTKKISIPQTFLHITINKSKLPTKILHSKIVEVNKMIEQSNPNTNFKKAKNNFDLALKDLKKIIAINNSYIQKGIKIPEKLLNAQKEIEKKAISSHDTLLKFSQIAITNATHLINQGIENEN